MSVVVDASVFVAASRSIEENHRPSLALLTRLRQCNEVVICPVTALAECAGAVARVTGDTALAWALVELIERTPGIRMIPIDLTVARAAAQMAASHRLRGADAVYAAVADEFGATLITWDREMLQRVKPELERMVRQLQQAIYHA